MAGKREKPRRKRADLPPDKQLLYDRWLAAVHLNGYEGMRDGRKLLDAYGAAKSLAEELIYNDDRQPRPRDIRDMAEAAGLPREWFLEEDLSKLIRPPGQGAVVHAPKIVVKDVEGEASKAVARLRQPDRKSRHSESG